MAFPSSLPAPLLEGYQIAPQDQTARTEMEFGAARVRRRTRARDDRLSVAWRLTDSQMATFRAWFEDDVSGAAGGAAWFDLDIQVGDGGTQNKEVRFVGPFSASALGRALWGVTATLEVR